MNALSKTFLHRRSDPSLLQLSMDLTLEILDCLPGISMIQCSFAKRSVPVLDLDKLGRSTQSAYSAVGRKETSVDKWQPSRLAIMHRLASCWVVGTGSCCRGVAEYDGPLPVASDTVRQILGNGVRAGMYPLSDRSVYWFVAMTCPQASLDRHNYLLI